MYELYPFGMSGVIADGVVFPIVVIGGLNSGSVDRGAICGEFNVVLNIGDMTSMGMPLAFIPEFPD